jgi:accessory gene regulator protein AgrB
MKRVRRVLSASVAPVMIAATIIFTFTVARYADGDVEAAPIVRGELEGASQ